MAEAEELFLEFAQAWSAKYPAIIRLWENAWAEFVPFLGFDREIRRIVCTTNAIESVNARIRKAVRASWSLPERAGRTQVRLPRRHGPRPHPPQQSPLDPTMETSTQRIRHPIRRPPQPPQNGMTTQPSYTVKLTGPYLGLNVVTRARTALATTTPSGQCSNWNPQHDPHPRPVEPSRRQRT